MEAPGLRQRKAQRTHRNNKSQDTGDIKSAGGGPGGSEREQVVFGEASLAKRPDTFQA